MIKSKVVIEGAGQAMRDSRRPKTSFKSIAFLTVGAGVLAGVVSTLLIGGAVTSMSPHIASLSEFVSTEGAMVMPAIFAGLASLGALCKGVEAKLTDNAAEKWAAKEKEETMNMTPEELKARKEKVGANILLAREKALANEEKAEATSRKVAAVGTFIALSS